MRHAFAVGLVQRVRNLDRELQHLIQREWAFLQALGQRLAFQILHHEEVNSILMPDVVEGADMRMVQAGNRSCFALQSFAQVRLIGKMRRQNFDRDDAI